MNYYESAEGEIVSKKRALEELENHGLNTENEIADFLQTAGNSNYYDAQTVLGYLGY